MDYINPDMVAVAAYNVCQQMQPDVAKIPGWADVALLIGTAAVESSFSTSAKGTGLGVFGIDLNAAKVLYTDFQHFHKPYDFRGWTGGNKHRRTSWNIFTRSWLGISYLSHIRLSRPDLRHLICHDVRFACAICRWSYLNIQDAVPENLLGVAIAWNKYHNTIAERSDTDFLDAWRDRECDLLMQTVGYR